jgi:hypothetical protein
MTQYPGPGKYRVRGAFHGPAYTTTVLTISDAHRQALWWLPTSPDRPNICCVVSHSTTHSSSFENPGMKAMFSSLIPTQTSASSPAIYIYVHTYSEQKNATCHLPRRQCGEVSSTGDEIPTRNPQTKNAVCTGHCREHLNTTSFTSSTGKGFRFRRACELCPWVTHENPNTSSIFRNPKRTLTNRFTRSSCSRR